jgi:hypothetical protein
MSFDSYENVVFKYQVMRVLCKEFGWTTNGEVLKAPAPGDR